MPKHLFFEITHGDFIEVPISKNMAGGILLYLQTCIIWTPCKKVLVFQSGVYKCTQRFTLRSHRLSRFGRVHLCNEYLSLRVVFWSKNGVTFR